MANANIPLDRTVVAGAADWSANARNGLLGSMLAPGERSGITVHSGRGMELTLSGGETVLDAGSLSSCLLGHCHPAIVEAIVERAQTVYVNDTTGYDPRQQAAEELLELAFDGEPWADAVVFTVSSSEASDLALMLAQMLTGRSALVSRELSYHGGVGLGRDASAHPLWSAGLVGAGQSTMPLRNAAVRHLPVPTCGGGVDDPTHDCATECLSTAPSLIRDAAAVIMDYTQGGIVPSPGYQDALAAIASDAGALWIADETVTSFGRFGRMFAFQRASSRPDMVVLGKGITGGGAPAGALVLSKRVVEAIGHRRWMTASTFRGHPLSVAAISAVAQTLVRDGLVEQAATNGAELGQRLAEIVKRRRLAQRVWGEGMLWFIELAARPEHGETVWQGGDDARPLTSIVQQRALARGVFIGVYSGTLLWVIPPLIATVDQLAAVCEALDGALAETDSELELQGYDLEERRANA